jgi:hypothetical protein
MGHYDDEPRRPWGQTWRDQSPVRNMDMTVRAAHLDVVVLDEYTENLGDALNAHMAEQYKQTALDKLFGVK